MVCWVGAKSQVYLTKKVKTGHHCDVNHREPQNQYVKLKKKLNRKTCLICGGFEQLSISNGWRVMAWNVGANIHWPMRDLEG